MLARMKARLIERCNRFLSFTVDVIYDRREDRKARIWGAVLWSLSILFRWISIIRYKLYRHRILRASHLGCMVIVVGNLTVGGTGKTPVVEKLARALSEKGRKVAILSRGYKSRREPIWRKWFRRITHTSAPEPRIVSDGKTVRLKSDIAGDEPYMLARNLPGVVVLTDKDRVKAGQYAISQFKADTLILDDGFQYFQLKDHFQLLLIDKSNPFGNEQLLPRGILREPVSHMARASYVFLTKSDGCRDAELVERIRRHRPGYEVIECTHEPKFLQQVNGPSRMGLDSLVGRRVAALSAIASPESFESYVVQLGGILVKRIRFLDHHRFQPGELQRVAVAAKGAGAEFLLTTEKDAVRIDESFDAGLPFYYLRVEIEMISGVDDFDEAVERICFPRESNRKPRSGNRSTHSPEQDSM